MYRKIPYKEQSRRRNKKEKHQAEETAARCNSLVKKSVNTGGAITRQEVVQL